MHASTKKWLFTKISSFILIPFMIWFIMSFVSIYENDYQEVVFFFTQQPTKILFLIFIVIAFFFSALTISEVFEDYIRDEKIKNVANKLLNIFAIVIPLLTIIGIYNLYIICRTYVYNLCIKLVPMNEYYLHYSYLLHYLN